MISYYISADRLIVQFVINGCGVFYISGYTAANKLYGILEIAAISYGFALTAYVGISAEAHRNRGTFPGRGPCMDRRRCSTHYKLLHQNGTDKQALFTGSVTKICGGFGLFTILPMHFTDFFILSAKL